jgi:acyl transferase domain-containing protein
LLINKKTTRGVVPNTRYNIESFYSPTKKPGFVASEYGHFLAESDALEYFDSSLFSLNKGEVEQLDPQQRMLLEVVWECMQNGGQKDWRGKEIGVYVATWSDVSPLICFLESG